MISWNIRWDNDSQNLETRTYTRVIEISENIFLIMRLITTVGSLQSESPKLFFYYSYYIDSGWCHYRLVGWLFRKTLAYMDFNSSTCVWGVGYNCISHSSDESIEHSAISIHGNVDVALVLSATIGGVPAAVSYIQLMSHCKFQSWGGKPKLMNNKLHLV